MANSPRRVYWDACTWIALIQKERLHASNGRLVEDRDALCRAVIAEAKRGRLEIATSSLSLAEVCKSAGVQGTSEDAIAAFFENDYVLLVNVDRQVGEHARTLMRAGHSSLKPPDAIHMATATIVQVAEMHTFDGRLLDLDGVLDVPDGTKLKVCKPDVGHEPLPLLKGIEHGEEAPSPGSI